MATKLDNKYYRTHWKDCHVDYHEGYKTMMVDFHMHDYYEVSLILSGKVKVLLSDQIQEGIEPRIVLTRPQTPHFISRDPDTFYSRLNLLFSHEFFADYVPECRQLQSVFGKRGKVILLSESQKEFFQSQILEIQAEPDLFRQRLKILCLLSHIAEIDVKGESETEKLPRYVTEALTYIEEHYDQKIVAADLAWKLNVGRTTLMTAFKTYTGSTLNDYAIRCRVKNALRLLRKGMTQQKAAELCGFGDTGSLIRGFKKCYGKTPKQYLASENE